MRRLRVAVAVALAAVALTGCKLDLPDAGSTDAPTGGTAAGLITVPDQGYQPVYQFIASAHTTLDMTMYELVDNSAEQALATDAHRGVRVRVVLDHKLEKANNQAAYQYLTSQGVHVAWANTRYAATHQKTITVDDKTSLIMTGNLTSRYYSTTRDFAIVDNTASDVTAIEQTFNADFGGKAFTPPNGVDLVWSPTTAEPDMVSVINAAKSSLLVENEEMANSTIENALTSAAHRGVKVQVVMTRSSDWTKDFDKLVGAGVQVATYSSSAKLYIHAKVIVADGTKALVGSENFSTASLTRNRELGLVISTPTIVKALSDVLTHDYAEASPWTT